MAGKLTPFKRYFYGNRNIVGSVLAIGAAALAALGYLTDGWLAIVAGAYGAGALITPGNGHIDVELTREMSDREILLRLDQIARTARKHVPATVAADIVTICEILRQALPALAHLPAGAPVAYDVRTTATEYLPQTLDRYVRMPPAFRATVRDRDGKTPATLLAEQIRLLKDALTRMAGDLASADMDRISANGLFLKEKFAAPAFADI